MYEEDSGEMNDIKKLQKEEIEKIFFDHMKEGKDIRIFLYMPVELLSIKVREQLDNYLADNAYENLFVKNQDFYYEDENTRLKPMNVEEELKHLNKMLKMYENEEQYEKCVKIRDKINSLKT